MTLVLQPELVGDAPLQKAYFAVRSEVRKAEHQRLRAQAYKEEVRESEQLLDLIEEFNVANYGISTKDKRPITGFLALRVLVFWRAHVDEHRPDPEELRSGESLSFKPARALDLVFEGQEKLFYSRHGGLIDACQLYDDEPLDQEATQFSTIVHSRFNEYGQLTAGTGTEEAEEDL
jgi:hypothetical protein